jgi:hypothetical protein
VPDLASVEESRISVLVLRNNYVRVFLTGAGGLVGRKNTDWLTLIRLLLSSRTALVAENLFLRRQIALFQERKVRRKTMVAARLAMIALARFFIGETRW